MEPTTNSDRRVKAVETAFSILETVSDTDGLRLTEIADELDLAKSTTHRYLQTLLAGEYLVTEGDEYHVSLRFLDLGQQARTRKEGYALAKAKVAELAQETDERAQFIVEEHGNAVYVHRKAGSHAVQTDPGIGKRIGLHTTSAGKAIIAGWPDEKIAEYVANDGLPERTDNTITDGEALREEVERIREQGYSVNNEENIEGLRAVGTAVCGDDGTVLGALSVSGPSNRMSGEWFETELPEMLMGFANEMELNLQYS